MDPMSYEPMSIHPNQVAAYRAAGFTVNYPTDNIAAMGKPSLPWSKPDADPLRDMYEVGEASRKAWPIPVTTWLPPVARGFRRP